LSGDAGSRYDPVENPPVFSVGEAERFGGQENEDDPIVALALGAHLHCNCVLADSREHLPTWILGQGDQHGFPLIAGQVYPRRNPLTSLRGLLRT
jgi:hypothetical protein